MRATAHTTSCLCTKTFFLFVFLLRLIRSYRSVSDSLQSDTGTIWVSVQLPLQIQAERKHTPWLWAHGTNWTEGGTRDRRLLSLTLDTSTFDQDEPRSELGSRLTSAAATNPFSFSLSTLLFKALIVQLFSLLNSGKTCHVSCCMFILEMTVQPPKESTKLIMSWKKSHKCSPEKRGNSGDIIITSESKTNGADLSHS